MNKEDFFYSLEKLGIKNNDALVVHSSFKSLGNIPFSAYEIIKFFIEYLNNGTLIFPTFTYRYVKEESPFFDVKNTKSCVGYLTEVFRTKFEVVRSIHPTHSVCAIGKNAIEITNKHYIDNTPCGNNSPFALLPKYNGKILMLGCGLKKNTIMHAIEEKFLPEYLFNSTLNYTITNNESYTYTKEYKAHYFEGYLQRYDRIEDSNNDNWIKQGKIFEAESFVLDSVRLWKEAENLFNKDINYFVDLE